MDAQAIPSYAPQEAAAHFKKMECFCFKQQTLAPNEARQIIENQHRVTFEPWAAMWGLGYIRATKPSHLDKIPDGAYLIEVIPDPDETEGFYSAME
jgi:hypothetical protein